MARINGREPIDLEVLKEIAEKESGGSPLPNSKPSGTVEKKPVPEKRFSYFDFFRSKDLRLTSICLMSIWFSWSVTFFGLSYNIKNVPGRFDSNPKFVQIKIPITDYGISNFTGNRYLNVVYMGLIDAVRK
jgi:hypothetical protein